MTTSVAMTTYNGERFIIGQLESIRTQSRLPDQVIISDDGSKDNTLHLIMDYIDKHHLENWMLIQNDHNLGWKQNFFQAIKRTTGEIVFFCDQDDV